MKKRKSTERTQGREGRAAAPGAERTFRAGCGRTWQMASVAPDLAYTALEFTECALCPHRIDSDGGGAFCTLRPEGTPHPFAGLAALQLTDE